MRKIAEEAKMEIDAAKTNQKVSFDSSVDYVPRNQYSAKKYAINDEELEMGSNDSFDSDQ